MTLARYDTLFEDFLQKIALTATQSNFIDVALEDAISLFMAQYNGDVEVYTQGSYTMGTIVKPLTANQSKNGNAGEYDIDIVLERGSWVGASDSLSSIRNVLLDEYEGKVDKKLRESCERVIHREFPTEVIFHADYVSIRPFNDRRAVAKRSKDKWYYSDTKKLIECFKDNFADNYTFLPALIVILKRIRDYAELTDDLPSLCVTAVVCNNYADQGSYAGDLLFMLDKLKAVFSVPYDQRSIMLAPLGSENLAQKISATSYIKIRQLFESCLSALRVAFSVGEIDGVTGYLSDDFPTDLVKYPECLEPLRNRGWGIEMDDSLSHRDIEETLQKGRLVRSRWVRFFNTGERLTFKANKDYRLDHNFGIRWQVLNSSKSKERRGDLFEARSVGGGKNSNEFENHETETYNGEHWIKYFIYDKRTRKVVEVGEKYFVEVVN